MLRLLGDKPLGARDAPTVARVLGADPIASCMVAARFETHGIDPRLLGGELWTADNPSTSLCFSGANLIPLVGTTADMNYFAERALSSARVCSSIVGGSDLVLAMWDRLSLAWGPARGEAGAATARIGETTERRSRSGGATGDTRRPRRLPAGGDRDVHR